MSEITDKRRHEVAEKLRRYSKATKVWCRSDSLDLIEAAIGTYRPTFDIENEYPIDEDSTPDEILTLLADLIDVPTCTMDLTRTEDMYLDLHDYETECNSIELHTWECSRCGHSCEEVYGVYEYCPHCGAKVVE